MTLSDDLNATADEIERRGWCQGVEQDENGKVCIIGAYNVSKGKHPLFYEWDTDNVVRAVNEYTGMHAVDWNDTEGRTQEEVTQMLRDCAIKHQPDSMWG